MQKLLLALATAVVLAGCGSPAADHDTAPPLVVCWSDATVTPAEFSASEVSIAVNPLDADHVVAAANGGIYTTLDGGTTWAAERVTGTMLSTSGNVMVPAASLSDPSVAFGLDGTLHIAYLAYIPASSVIVLSRAEPMAAWVVHTVWQSEVAGTMNDKEWLGIDPRTGTLIVAWQREPAMDSLRAIDETTGITDVDVGLIVASRSTDDGATWSLPVTVSSGLHNNGTQVAFTDDGRSHILFVDYEAPGLVHSISTDDGATWSDPTPVADLHLVGRLGQFTRMHTLPGLAAFGNRLAAAWHDARHDQADVLVSLYDGLAWSSPQRVPDDAEGSRRIQLYPWLAFDGAGDLHVSYYAGDLGNLSYTAIRLHDGAWNAPLPLSTPFALVDENGTVADIGDYTGMAASGADVHAAWAQRAADGTGSAVHVAGRYAAAAC